MTQTPTIVHNDTPYTVDLNRFIALSLLIRDFSYQNPSLISMNIQDQIDDQSFQLLIDAVNSNTCVNILKSIGINNLQGIFDFLKSSIVYQISLFVEEVCQFIIDNNNIKNNFATLNFLTTNCEYSETLDRYFAANLLNLYNLPEFAQITPPTLGRILEKLPNESIFKNPHFISFIVQYIHNFGKESCLILQYFDFKDIYNLDNGKTLDDFISNDLIDFDLIGQKLVNDLKPWSKFHDFDSTAQTNFSKTQIEEFETNIKALERETQLENNRFSAEQTKLKQLQAEYDKLESSFKSFHNQLELSESKIESLTIEKAEAESTLKQLIEEEKQQKRQEELELIAERERIEREQKAKLQQQKEQMAKAKQKQPAKKVEQPPPKQKKVEPKKPVEQPKQEVINEPEPKQQSDESNQLSMPLWCPRPTLHPPEKSFDKTVTLQNLKKIETMLKIVPTEALKGCFSIFGIKIEPVDDMSSKLQQIPENDRATLLDFLARASEEYHQPEICACLGTLLAATDSSCDDYSVSLLLDAAEKKVPEAIYNAGIMAKYGRGVEQSDEMAAEMITEAANLGYDIAFNVVKACL